MSSEEQDRLLIVGALESTRALCRRKLIDATRLTELRLDLALSALCRAGRVTREGRAYRLSERT